MKKLIAKQSILFESKLYAPGAELPTKNTGMVEAWIEAGTAIWIEDETNNAKAKALPKTAEPGQPGVSVASESENGEDLVGKVPKTTGRKKETKK